MSDLTRPRAAILTPLARRLRREEGSALPAVLALLLVATVVTATVAGSTVRGMTVSTAGRADVQAKAAADAGVDAALAELTAGRLRCGLRVDGDPISYDVTITYRSTSPAATYCAGATSASTALAALPQQSLTAIATITSVGTANDPALTPGSAANTATVGASVTVEQDVETTPGTPGTAGDDDFNVDKVIFSEATLNLRNQSIIEDSKLLADASDADIYSNGNIDCVTGGGIVVDGDVVAQGNVAFSNGCSNDGVLWAGGTASVDASTVRGSVYSAGTGTVVVRNNATVTGDLIANGSVELDNSRVGSPATRALGLLTLGTPKGSAVSLTGQVTLKNGARVGGSVYAKGNVHIQDGNKDTILLGLIPLLSRPDVGRNVLSTTGSLTFQNRGSVEGDVAVKGTYPSSGNFTISGAKCANCVTGFPAALNPSTSQPEGLGYPTAVTKPAREQFPRIDNSATDLATWVAKGWTKVEFTGSNSCQQAKDYLNKTWTSATSKLLLVVKGCSEPMTWNGGNLLGIPGLDLRDYLWLKGNLAIFSDSGFRMYNNAQVAPLSLSALLTQIDLYFLVPSSVTSWNVVGGTTPTQYSPGSCSKNISIDNSVVVSTTSLNVDWFLYSPCSVTLQNKITGFTGSIYGANVSYPDNSILKKSYSLSIPGLDAAGNPGTPGTPATPGATTVTVTSTLTSRYDVAGG